MKKDENTNQSDRTDVAPRCASSFDGKVCIKEQHDPFDAHFDNKGNCWVTLMAPVEYIRLNINMDDSPRFRTAEMDKALADCKRLHVHNVEMDPDGFCFACGCVDPED